MVGEMGARKDSTIIGKRYGKHYDIVLPRIGFESRRWNAVQTGALYRSATEAGPVI